jgi:hypothetical protein
MINVTQGDFVVTKKYVNDSNEVLMFDWKIEYSVEGAITPLESQGTELVTDGSGLTVDSSDQDYKDFLASTKVSDFFDTLYQFNIDQAPYHLIRETATEIEPV